MIVNFIKKYAPFSRTLNLRIYKRASELKKSGLDWQSTVLNELEIDNRLYVIEKLLKDYKTDEKRLEVWKKKTTKSRANYYTFKNTFLRKTGQRI